MAITVQVKPKKTTISSVTVARTANLNLAQINNIDLSNPENGHVLTYEAASGKWVNKTIEVIQGGTF
ncbi:MAG: hypothetical protein ACO239_00530 [Sediminibacterium sp.]